MCMNCGCGMLDTRHKDTDLVREDVRSAAHGQGSSVEDTLENLEQSIRKMRATSEPLQRTGATSTSTPTMR